MTNRCERHARGPARYRGASTVEYALALALVVLTLPPAIGWLKDSSSAEFQSRATSAGAPDAGVAPPTVSSTTIPATTLAATTTTASLPIDATASLTVTANRQGNSWSATVTVTVVDQSGQPVAGVLVTGAWNPALSGETSCTTAANGQCSMTQAGMEARDNKPFVASVTFSITAVTKSSNPGFSYNQSPIPSVGPIARPM